MLKVKINNFLRRFDYQFIKVPFSQKKINSGFYRWLNDLQIKTIIDVGANEGQFADNFIKIFPDAIIFSFEPLHETFKILEKKFEANQRIKLFNYACGEVEQETFIYHNDFSPSSSLLEITDLHKDAFPFTAHVKKEKITIKRLDDVMKNIVIESKLLLKIDVQGYEMSVLKGAEETLAKSDIIIIETSFQELYKNQPMFKDIYEFLSKYNFDYCGCLEQIYDERNGRILQADSIFVKK